MESESSDSLYRMLSGRCPDAQCGTKLFFPAYDKSIVCTNCGQRHNQNVIKDVQEVKNPDVALHNILKNLLVGNIKPKKGADSVKVLGLSNYQCKLISPLLTQYGMDKRSGEAKLLKDMGQGDKFDCGILGDRSFLIEQENINVTGYGRDNTGSMEYLKDTLDSIKRCNDNEERLLPIHADGDGHCLVHAVSRALIGRELFWHALRDNLKSHFLNRLDTYKSLFSDFIDDSEWRAIIAESDPDYIPGFEEVMGLRNIHIFGLANVLHRPIILLDSLCGIQSSGDYTGVFLPSLSPPDECRDKDGKLRKPLCLAWSSNGHNHYIALVGVKGRPLPKIPNWMFPKAWGVPQESIPDYIDMDDQGRVTVCGDRCIQGSYLLKLVSAMEQVFSKEHGVNTGLVSDYHQYVLKQTGMVGIRLQRVISQTHIAVQSRSLYRCLLCEAVIEWQLDPTSLLPSGELYMIAASHYGPLDPTKRYSFPKHGVVCRYNKDQDQLELDPSVEVSIACHWCQGTVVRRLNGDGSVEYKNGDRTLIPAPKSKCQCGFKHYWNGQLYDNLPDDVPIALEWGGRAVKDTVHWFQNESDTNLNSNVYQVAQNIVQKHFPGEFGSERLVQKVVDTIWQSVGRATSDSTKGAGSDGKKAGVKSKEEEPGEKMEVLEGRHGGEGESERHIETDDAWRKDSPSKIILTGYKSRTFHREELTQSETERSVRRRVEENAPLHQRRRTDELARQHTKESHKDKPVAMDTTESDEKRSPVRREGQRRVKVSTSDGQQVTLNLGVDCTYSQLLLLLQQEAGVDDKKISKIRYGFPPKELHPPDPPDQPLPFQDGDRITVEIHKDPTPQPDTTMSDVSQQQSPWPARPTHSTSWSGFEADAQLHTAQDLLQQLTQIHKRTDKADPLDTSIESLPLTAALMGKDVWSYVQTMPHLFSVGGLLYQQVKRDLGLHDGKHCTLPSLPGKVFRYSAKEDRLELCLEPHGHFAVEPGIEAKVTGGQIASTDDPSALQRVGSDISAGGSGVIVNKSLKFPTKQVPFSGTAHSLGGRQVGGASVSNHTSFKEDIKMPQDLEIPSSPGKRNPKSKAMKFQHFSHSGSRPSSVEEEEMDGLKDEAVSMETGEEIPQTSYRRLGPGYTVIDHQGTNAVNSTLETFQTLTSKIGNLVNETTEAMEEETDDRVPDLGEESKGGKGEEPGLIDDAHSDGETIMDDSKTCLIEMKGEGDKPGGGDKMK